LIFIKIFVIIYISNEGSQKFQKNNFLKNFKKMLTNFKKYDIINISNETNKQFQKKKEVYFYGKEDYKGSDVRYD
jgi:hypothetical protein